MRRHNTLGSFAALFNHLTGPVCNGRNRRRRMTTNLLRKDAGIDNAKPIRPVHAALYIDNAVGGRRPHPRRTDGVVEGECPLDQVAPELVVGHGVGIAARIRPPVRRRVVIRGDGVQVLLEGWAAHNLETEAESGNQDLFVIVLLVGEILGVNDG